MFYQHKEKVETKNQSPPLFVMKINRVTILIMVLTIENLNKTKERVRGYVLVIKKLSHDCRVIVVNGNRWRNIESFNLVNNTLPK